MAQGRNFVTALMVGTASISMIVAGTTVPAAAQAATGSYRIESQPLGQALMQLSRQANVDIVAPAKITRGRVAKAVVAESVDAALKQMLSGSGLTFKRAGQRYVIQSGNGSGAANGGAQGGGGGAAPAPTEASVSGSNVVAVPSASASTVVDARTGAALKGALVEIVETGEKTSTGDLGEFRFPGKTGSFNLRISYLGYPEYEQFVDLKDGRAAIGILLSDGSATGDIVVTAYQSARAQALNQERTAENVSTVISDDLLGQFDGTTISDALRRAPGVAFEADPATGDGVNVIVRGMSAAFNTVTLNGLRLPAGDGESRSPSLNNILADSISSITINKTLLPNQDGSGTGALIEIETKGPLDRPVRYFNVAADRGIAGRDFLSDKSLSGTASMRFGADRNFGISVNAQYRKREVRQIQVGGGYSYGKYLPQGFALSSFDPAVRLIDPRTPFPFEASADERYQTGFSILQSRNTIENLSYGASAQWAIGGHTNLSLDFSRNEAEVDQLQRDINFVTPFAYLSLPIADLNGEVRNALVWENAQSSRPGLRIRPTHTYRVVDGRTNKTTVLSFRGDTRFGKWEFEYGGGYTKGDTFNPAFVGSVADQSSSTYKTLTRAHLLDRIAQDTNAGLVISLYGPNDGSRILFPGLNDAGYAVINDSSTYVLRDLSYQQQTGYNERYTGNFDAKYEFDSKILRYVQIGAFYERSTTAFDPNLVLNSYSTSASLNQLGLNFGEDALRRIGVSSGVKTIQEENFLKFYRDVRAGTNPLVADFPQSNNYDPNIFKDKTSEEDIAAYLQTSLKFGRLEIIGGVRFERIATSAYVVYGPQIFDEQFQLDQAYFNENAGLKYFTGVGRTFLPRILLNYRFDDNKVVRLGYYSTIARPSLSQLSLERSIFLQLSPTFGPAGNQPQLLIQTGNPNLKSATTHNIDISFEWYFSDVGAIKAGAFYKPTQNSFMSATRQLTNGVPADVELPDDPRFQTPNLYILTFRPENSPELEKLWGMEFSIERKLNFLPGALSGLGVYANYTYSDSSRTLSRAFSAVPGGQVFVKGLAYTAQPPHSGTFALTYGKKGLDASLAYTIQSGYYSGFPNFGFQTGRGSIDTLDLKVSYQTKIRGATARLFLEGSNLLKGPTDPTLGNSEKSLETGAVFPTTESYLGGRILKAGLSVSF